MKAPSKPGWAELTPAQQSALQPLAAHWSGISESQKRKWLALSSNYTKLAPEEQAKMRSRMTEWVSLSAQQRSEARLNFAETRQLAPDDKKAKWQAYQALSPEEKQKLAAKAVAKPAGAATAVKPVPPQKLAVVPAVKQNPKLQPKIAAGPHQLDNHTLLPQSAATVPVNNN